MGAATKSTKLDVHSYDGFTLPGAMSDTSGARLTQVREDNGHGTGSSSREETVIATTTSNCYSSSKSTTPAKLKNTLGPEDLVMDLTSIPIGSRKNGANKSRHRVSESDSLAAEAAAATPSSRIATTVSEHEGKSTEEGKDIQSTQRQLLDASSHDAQTTSTVVLKQNNTSPCTVDTWSSTTSDRSQHGGKLNESAGVSSSSSRGAVTAAPTRSVSIKRMPAAEGAGDASSTQLKRSSVSQGSVAATNIELDTSRGAANNNTIININSGTAGDGGGVAVHSNAKNGSSRNSDCVSITAATDYTKIAAENSHVERWNWGDAHTSDANSTITIVITRKQIASLSAEYGVPIQHVKEIILECKGDYNTTLARLQHIKSIHPVNAHLSSSHLSSSRATAVQGDGSTNSNVATTSPTKVAFSPSAPPANSSSTSNTTRTIRTTHSSSNTLHFRHAPAVTAAHPSKLQECSSSAAANHTLESGRVAQKMHSVSTFPDELDTLAPTLTTTTISAAANPDAPVHGSRAHGSNKDRQHAGAVQQQRSVDEELDSAISAKAMTTVTQRRRSCTVAAANATIDHLSKKLESEEGGVVNLQQYTQLASLYPAASMHDIHTALLRANNNMPRARACVEKVLAHKDKPTRNCAAGHSVSPRETRCSTSTSTNPNNSTANNKAKSSNHTTTKIYSANSTTISNNKNTITMSSGSTGMDESNKEAHAFRTHSNARSNRSSISPRTVDASTSHAERTSLQCHLSPYMAQPTQRGRKKSDHNIARNASNRTRISEAATGDSRSRRRSTQPDNNKKPASTHPRPPQPARPDVLSERALAQLYGLVDPEKRRAQSARNRKVMMETFEKLLLEASKEDLLAKQHDSSSECEANVLAVVGSNNTSTATTARSRDAAECMGTPQEQRIKCSHSPDPAQTALPATAPAMGEERDTLVNRRQPRSVSPSGAHGYSSSSSSPLSHKRTRHNTQATRAQVPSSSNTNTSLPKHSSSSNDNVDRSKNNYSGSLDTVDDDTGGDDRVKVSLGFRGLLSPLPATARGPRQADDEHVEKIGNAKTMSTTARYPVADVLSVPLSASVAAPTPRKVDESVQPSLAHDHARYSNNNKYSSGNNLSNKGESNSTHVRTRQRSKSRELLAPVSAIANERSRTMSAERTRDMNRTAGATTAAAAVAGKKTHPLEYPAEVDTLAHTSATTATTTATAQQHVSLPLHFRGGSSSASSSNSATTRSSSSGDPSHRWLGEVGESAQRHLSSPSPSILPAPDTRLGRPILPPQRTSGGDATSRGRRITLASLQVEPHARSGVAGEVCATAVTRGGSAGRSMSVSDANSRVTSCSSRRTVDNYVKTNLDISSTHNIQDNTSKDLVHPHADYSARADTKRTHTPSQGMFASLQDDVSPILHGAKAAVGRVQSAAHMAESDEHCSTTFSYDEEYYDNDEEDNASESNVPTDEVDEPRTPSRVCPTSVPRGIETPLYKPSARAERRDTRTAMPLMHDDIHKPSNESPSALALPIESIRLPQLGINDHAIPGVPQRVRKSENTNISNNGTIYNVESNHNNDNYSIRSDGTRSGMLHSVHDRLANTTVDHTTTRNDASAAKSHVTPLQYNALSTQRTDTDTPNIHNRSALLSHSASVPVSCTMAYTTSMRSSERQLGAASDTAQFRLVLSDELMYRPEHDNEEHARRDLGQTNSHLAESSVVIECAANEEEDVPKARSNEVSAPRLAATVTTTATTANNNNTSSIPRIDSQHSNGEDSPQPVLLLPTSRITRRPPQHQRQQQCQENAHLVARMDVDTRFADATTATTASVTPAATIRVAVPTPPKGLPPPPPPPKSKSATAVGRTTVTTTSTAAAVTSLPSAPKGLPPPPPPPSASKSTAPPPPPPPPHHANDAIMKTTSVVPATAASPSPPSKLPPPPPPPRYHSPTSATGTKTNSTSTEIQGNVPPPPPPPPPPRFMNQPSASPVRSVNSSAPPPPPLPPPPSLRRQSVESPMRSMSNNASVDTQRVMCGEGHVAGSAINGDADILVGQTSVPGANGSRARSEGIARQEVRSTRALPIQALHDPGKSVFTDAKTIDLPVDVKEDLVKLFPNTPAHTAIAGAGAKAAGAGQAVGGLQSAGNIPAYGNRSALAVASAAAGAAAAAVAAARQWVPQIIDVGREHNVGIVLQFLRLPIQRIESSIRAFDEETLGDEHIDGLLKILPTPHDIEAIENYLAKVGKKKLKTTETHAFSLPVRFFFMTTNIDHYASRIRAWGLKLELRSRLEDYKTKLLCVLNGVMAVLDSVYLPDIMHFLLSVSNFLNAGTRFQDAKGFPITQLPHIINFRTTNGKGVLLEYIVHTLNKVDPTLHLVTRELMPAVDHARDSEVVSIAQEVRKLRGRLDQCDALVKSIPEDTRWVSVLSEFMSETTPELKVVEEIIERLNKETERLREFVCESAETFSLNEVMRVLTIFCKRYDQEREKQGRQAAHKQQTGV